VPEQFLRCDERTCEIDENRTRAAREETVEERPFRAASGKDE
jgi:hypothetical protein